jgi:hypothetical protein
MPRISQGVTTVSDLLRELNPILERIESALNRTPRLDSDGNLDLRNRRILRVGRTKGRDEVPSRRELEDKGLYETPAGDHVAHSSLIATGGIRSKHQAKHPDELVPLRQVQRLLGDGTGSSAVLTTNIDQVVLGYKQFLGLAFAQVGVACVNGNNGTVQIALAAGSLGCFVRVTGPTAAYTIGGFRRAPAVEGGFAGQVFILHNATNFPLTLLHEDTGQPADSRIRIPQSTSSSTNGMAVRRFGSVILIYEHNADRWVAASFA